MLHEFQLALQIKIVQNWPNDAIARIGQLRMICVFMMRISSNPRWKRNADGSKIDPAIVQIKGNGKLNAAVSREIDGTAASSYMARRYILFSVYLNIGGVI